MAAQREPEPALTPDLLQRAFAQLHRPTWRVNTLDAAMQDAVYGAAIHGLARNFQRQQLRPVSLDAPPVAIAQPPRAPATRIPAWRMTGHDARRAAANDKDDD